MVASETACTVVHVLGFLRHSTNQEVGSAQRLEKTVGDPYIEHLEGVRCYRSKLVHYTQCLVWV